MLNDEVRNLLDGVAEENTDTDEQVSFTVTDILNLVISKVVNRTVEVPNDMTVTELNSWLNGYAMCQNDILELVDDLKG